MSQAKFGAGTPRMAMYGDMENIVVDYINKIIEDPTYTAEQAVVDMQKQIDEAITLYNMSKGK